MECVQAVLTRIQQKGKRPIQHLGEPDAKGQFNPIMGISNLSSVMGLLPNMGLDSVGQSNEVSIMEASVLFQVVPFSTQFYETSYLLKDPLMGKNSKELRLLFQFQVQDGRIPYFSELNSTQ